MDLFRMRYPERATTEIEEYTEVTVSLGDNWEANIVSDDEFWAVHFTKNGVYVATRVCADTIGVCIDKLMAEKENTINALIVGNFL